MCNKQTHNDKLHRQTVIGPTTVCLRFFVIIFRNMAFY